MNHDSVKEAIEEAKRFLTAAWTWQKAERCKKKPITQFQKKLGRAGVHQWIYPVLCLN